MGGARLFLLEGGQETGHVGQILAMEGLLMDAGTITGGQLGGKARHGAAAPFPPPARTAHAHGLYWVKNV